MVHFDFLGRHFASGESRDAARYLWRVLEGLGIELSRLHPDDDLSSILSAFGDSLDAAELVMALAEELGPIDVGKGKAPLGSFRDCVERMVRNGTREW